MTSGDKLRFETHHVLKHSCLTFICLKQHLSTYRERHVYTSMIFFPFAVKESTSSNKNIVTQIHHSG